MCKRANVGCGPLRLPGYINLDMQTYAECTTWSSEFQQLDVREGLPFKDGDLCEVRADQFIEHLQLWELTAFLDECKHVLCVGGEVRVSFPDIIGIVSTHHDPTVIGEFKAVPGVPDDLVVLNMMPKAWGHQTILTLDLVVPMFQDRFTVLWAVRYLTNGLIIARK